MAIFRGEGGAGASDTNATVSLVTQQAVISTTKASEAAEHATTASTHSDTAAARATAASASATTAANISTGVAAYANAAIASASSAETAKTNAETAETNAETAESNASTHATIATTKASEAVTSASSASTSASSASSSASTASTHATNAASSASTSATQASNAASSATAAETAKTNAQTAKTNAETAETNAASSATAAATSATNAASSATAASDFIDSIGTDLSFNSVTITGNTALQLPAGTTAQRPTPTTGQFRYNSTLGEFEGYTTEWGSVGGGSADITLNQFTGDGSDTTFTLSGLATENNTFVYIDGVYQSKNNYTVSTADPAVLTFSTAPPNTTAIEVMSAAISVSNIGTPSDNTVSTAKILDGAVTTAKIADDAVTTAKIVDDAVTSDKLAHSLDVVTDLSIGGASDGVEISNGAIALKNSGTQSKIDFYCEASNAHYTRIQAAPHGSYTGNVVLTLPASDGDAGQVLQTDGSGVMSWATGGVSPTIHSYRYWRMTNFGDYSSNTYLGMWVFYDDYDGAGNVLAGGPNAVTAGITATASHSNADADHPLSTSPYSYWNAGTQALALQQTWIKYAFTSSKTVKSMSVAYRPWNGNSGFGGGYFQIEGSNDNTNWVRIHSVGPLDRSSSYFEASYSTLSMENTFNLV